MEIVFNQQYNSIEEINDYLLQNNIVYEYDGEWFLDVSKLLRPIELTLNLEMIDLALRLISTFSNEFKVSGKSRYYNLRDINKESKWKEEWGFIENYTKNVFENILLEKEDELSTDN